MEDTRGGAVEGSAREGTLEKGAPGGADRPPAEEESAILLWLKTARAPARCTPRPVPLDAALTERAELAPSPRGRRRGADVSSSTDDPTGDPDAPPTVRDRRPTRQPARARASARDPRPRRRRGRGGEPRGARPRTTLGLRINTNIQALQAQRHLAQVTERIGTHFARLSSGLRIATAADDPAGLGISERMRAQVRSLAVARRNIEDGIGMVRTAEAALGEVGDLFVRMRELALSSLNGTLSSADRAVIATEYEELAEELTRQVDAAEFNGIQLFDVKKSVAFQVGTDPGDTIDVALPNLTISGPFMAALDITTETGAKMVLQTVDASVDILSEVRGRLGATENRLESALATAFQREENLSAAESRIRDVDVAEQAALLAKDQILQQAASSVLAQATFLPAQTALALLEGAGLP